MAGKSASLLTKTQRRRLRTEFEEVDENAKRRDQQLIRERVRTGIHDFRLLTDYPDRQLELAFEADSEEELRVALADTYLIAERIRDLHRYDRDQLLTEARARAEDVATEATDVRSIDRLDLRTEAEVRQQTENAIEERLGWDRWETRAIGLLKFGVGVFGVGFLFLYLYDNIIHTNIVAWLAGGFAIVALLLGVVSATIIGLHALRYDISPVFTRLSRQSRKRGETVRERWDNRNGTDDSTAWWKWGTTSASSTDEDEPPLDRLRRRYAAGELTDEQFEQKLERLLDTETVEDAAIHVKSRE